MKFQPVNLPDDRRLDGRASQTFLRHYQGCPRSGFLYAKYKGEASTVELVRGRAVHEINERGTNLALEQGEPYVPPDIVKVIVNEVLAEQQVPFAEHDYIRECAYRWAANTAFPPADQVLAVERLLVMDVAGYEIRMKVDYAEMLEGGAAVHVVDYKSARAMPAQEEISRRRPDGTLAAKSFQLVLYALGLRYGLPVRVEEHLGERVEIREPFPLAERAQRFDLDFVFPGIEVGGEMGRRSMTLTPLELEEYRASVEALLANVRRSEETGDWPAIVSDAACSECPSRPECPIPRELRDHRGTINTMDEAAEAAQVLEREKAEHRARQAELRSFAKAHGGAVPFGKKVWELVTSDSERIGDKDAMFAAVERARLYGEEFDRSRFVKTVTRTDFVARDMTVEELAVLAAGAEGSNEAEVQDGRDGRDD